MNKLLPIILLIFTTNVFSCEYPKQISQGELSDCSGYIITEDQLLKSGKAIRDNRLKDVKLADLEATVERQETRNTNYRVDLQKATNDLSALEFTSKIGYVISFGLGVALTTMIVRGIK